MTSNSKQQAKTFDDICYAAFATHFKVVLRSKIKPGEDADVAARREWNDNLPGIALCWHGLVQGMLINVAEAQRSGALPALIDTKPAPLPGLGEHIGMPVDRPSPGALASRLAGEMRARQDAARAASPVPPHTQAQASSPYPYLPGGALDVAPGLAIGRDTEAPAAVPDPTPDPGYSGGGGDTGGGGSSGDY
jgi:hypothetical protein